MYVYKQNLLGKVKKGMNSSSQQDVAEGLQYVLSRLFEDSPVSDTLVHVQPIATYTLTLPHPM